MREHAPGSPRNAGNLPAPDGSAPNVRVQMAMQRRLIQRKAEAGEQPEAKAGEAEAGEAQAEAPDTAKADAADGGDDAAPGGDAPGGDKADAAADEKGGEESSEPLADNLQEEFGTALGADFSGVVVFKGAKANAMAKKIGARAYTEGNKIYFAEGAYNPSSAEGKELIAHELTHVVQQGAAPRKEAPPSEEKDEKDAKDEGTDAAPGEDVGETAEAEATQTKLEISSPGDAAEREADHVAASVVRGGHARPQAAKSADINRVPDGTPAKKDAKGDAKGDAKPAAPGAEASKIVYPPGTTGILKSEATVNLGGADVKLQAGTVLKVVGMEPDKLKVKVYSGHEGKEGKIDAKNFEQQPGVAVDENSGKERDDVYKDFGKAALWGADGPNAGDVKQGFIGDCFLMAAMGAVAASNPGAIKALFSPQESGAGSYTVSLFKKDDNTGDLVKHAVAVDSMMPAQNDAGLSQGAEAGPGTKLAYAGNNDTTASAKLWPSLIEKAYAILNNGMAAIGGGGSPATAMEALTGVESQGDVMPKEDEVLNQFKGYQKDGKAVVVATLGSKSHKSDKLFKEDGGQYKAQLTTTEGDSDYVELVQNTLDVRDDVSKHKFNATDVGKGKLVSPDLEDSSVDYGKAKVSMKFKADKKPEKPENLTAEYDYRGRISKDLEVFAHHAYIFEKVDGQNLIFKNPWGTWDPKPIPAADFLKLFSGISYNQVPSPEEGPPGGGT
jgi:hypothetical protein